MSEVEKMYEKAGIEKCNNRLKEIIPDVCLKNNKDENYKCEDCEYNWYPEFTAEKKLELIKWLCKKTYRNYLLIRYNFTNYYWQIECNMTDSDKLDNFAETLASMVNDLWQDLTEQERTEIAEILRG